MALRIYRTEAVVLRQRRLGDAGKICVLFTPNLGRIEAVAKGVRRPRSKLAGHLEPLTRVSLLLAKGRSLDTITQAQALDSFAPLREEIERLSRALYVAELVDRMTDAAPDVGGLYRLLVDTIERLGATEALDLAVRWFEMRLLMEQGYQPNLERCVRCNAELALEGNGFAALGYAEALTYLQPDSPVRSDLAEAHRSHLWSMLAHAAPSGKQRQLTDFPGSYEELSATCMIGIALARGVRLGSLPATYLPELKRSWNAASESIADDGGLVDVCTGTGPQFSVREYLDRPAISGLDDRGGAMAMWFALEMAKLESATG